MGGHVPRVPHQIAPMDRVPLYIQNIPPVFCERLSTWFQVFSKKWRLEINEFHTYCDIILADDSFFSQALFVSIIQILQFVHLLFPY